MNKTVRIGEEDFLAEWVASRLTRALELEAENERLRAALTEIRRIDQYRNPNVVSQDDAQDGPCAKIARAALAPVPPQDSGR